MVPQKPQMLNRGAAGGKYWQKIGSQSSLLRYLSRARFKLFLLPSMSFVHANIPIASRTASFSSAERGCFVSVPVSSLMAALSSILYCRYLVSCPKGNQIAACDDPPEFARQTNGRRAVFCRVGTAVVYDRAEVADADINRDHNDQYPDSF